MMNDVATVDASSETFSAERGAEAGADFALYGDIDLEDGVKVIRAEAKARVADTGMTEAERKAYVSSFVSAARDALGI